MGCIPDFTLILRRGGRVAEGGGLLNRWRGKPFPGVRIPSSPPFSFISNLKEAELLAAPLVLQWKKLIEEAKHGMFSYFLMKGMEGEADANNDHQITAGELDAYVEQNAV